MKSPSIKIMRIFAFAIAFAPVLVFAVGGGGGGSVPTCSQDTWTCTDWSGCSTNSIQNRTCSLSYDCSSADTPKPNEQQSCTPPASPPALTHTPAPAACSADKWTCTEWSKSCDINGLEKRSCKLSSDCPDAATPPPQINQTCSHLQCGDKTTLSERISCRLNLASAGIARELAIKYLPEECRVIKSKSEQTECIVRYKAYAPCWEISADEKRSECARNILKLGPVISDEVKKCQDKTGKDQVSCKAAIREKVFYMIKFRFYNLEQRAEDLARRGANLDSVSELETTIELKKQAFDNAKTDDDRKQMILDVRIAWQNFIEKIKDEVK